MTINFKITSDKFLSQTFREKGITDFQKAANFIRYLPYGRNADKLHLETVFKDRCGTCSTKHALLFALAPENGFNEIRLFTGIFRMSATNTPQLRDTFLSYGLDYIPEAHCYIKTNSGILDVTTADASPEDFLADLLMETMILPEQITNFKVAYHKNYLQQWLSENSHILYTMDELLLIREQCIKNLELNSVNPLTL